MDVPVRQRNALLSAAGLRPVYAERDLDEAELEPFSRAVDLVLSNHAPYPGCAIDGWGTVRRTNAAFERLWPGAVGISPEDGVDAFFGPGPARAQLHNWAEVAWRTLDLRRHEAATRNDPRLQALVDRAARHLTDVPRPASADTVAAPVVCPRFRVGDRIVAMFSTVLRFEHADDVSLHELKVELLFPADAAAAAFFRPTTADAR